MILLSSHIIFNFEYSSNEYTAKICKCIVNVRSYFKSFNLSKIFSSKKQTLARLQFLPQQIPKNDVNKNDVTISKQSIE